MKFFGESEEKGREKNAQKKQKKSGKKVLEKSGRQEVAKKCTKKRAARFMFRCFTIDYRG